MAINSNKYKNTLLKDFLKDYKKLESYLKNKLDTLKKYYSLKEYQYNENISDFDYFKLLIYNVGFEIFDFNIYSKYKDYYTNSYNNLKTIKTNILYINSLKLFYNYNLSKSKTNIFDIMNCIISTDENLDLNKLYTINDLINLVETKKILILDSSVEEFNNENIDYSKFNIAKSQINNMTDKLFQDFIEAKNEDDRKLWFFINGEMCKFIRKNVVNFKDNNNESLCLNSEYNEIVNNIKETIRDIEKYYTKKHKQIPNNYKKLIDEINTKLLDEIYKYYNIDEKIKIVKSN